MWGHRSLGSNGRELAEDEKCESICVDEISHVGYACHCTKIIELSLCQLSCQWWPHRLLSWRQVCTLIPEYLALYQSLAKVKVWFGIGYLKQSWHSLPTGIYIYLKYAHVLRFNMFVAITMTSQWAPWRLKSPAPQLFTQPFIQGADQRKHQSSASLAFVRRIHRWPLNFPHKGPVTRK